MEEKVYQEYPLIENILQNLAYRHLKNEYKCYKVSCKNGQEILIEETTNDSNKVLLFCMGGLNSYSSSPYVRGFVYEMINRGYKVVIVNHRGVGCELNQSSTLSIHTDDELVELGVQHCLAVPVSTKPRQLYACGISLGAHMLTNYIATHPNVFIGFVGISNYFDAFSQFQIIQSNRYLNYYVTLTYANLLRQMGILNIWSFLDRNPIRYMTENLLFRYHDRLHDWETFYSQSNLTVMDKIATPTLFVNSENDFFTSRIVLDLLKKKFSSDYVQFKILSTGSHVGYSKEQMADFCTDFFKM